MSLWWSQFNDEQLGRFERAEAVIQAHGAHVAAQPIPGKEELFLKNLEAEASALLKLAEDLRTVHGYLGISGPIKRALRDRINKAGRYELIEAEGGAA